MTQQPKFTTVNLGSKIAYHLQSLCSFISRKEIKIAQIKKCQLYIKVMIQIQRVKNQNYSFSHEDTNNNNRICGLYLHVKWY